MYICGGVNVYATSLKHKYCKRVLRTCLLSDKFQDFDVFFPKLLEDEWKRVSCSDVMEENGLKFVFEDFRKIESETEAIPEKAIKRNGSAGNVSRNYSSRTEWYDTTTKEFLDGV